MLRKFGIIAVLSLIVVALAAVPALAKVNLTEQPTCTVSADNSTITCTGGHLAGLANTSTQIFYTGAFVCQTQRNQNQPPGQRQSPVVTTTPANGQIDLGNLDPFVLTAGCHGTQTSIAPSTVTLNVVQGNRTFTFPIPVT
jgi:hypothetical protein